MTALYFPATLSPFPVSCDRQGGDMIGRTIAHYKILEKLGAGGMGVVYKAEDTKLKRTVALKFLSHQSLGSAEERSRFLHEAQAAAALDHPNICTIHEINEIEEKTFDTIVHGVRHINLGCRIDSCQLAPC